MSKQKQFAPEQETAANRIPELYRWRTLIIFCVMLVLILLWAYFCRGCISLSGGSSLGFGSGGSNFGTGPGSGNSGDGPGAGKNGDNKGKFDDAQGRAGIGKDASEPGTANPSSGTLAIDGTTAATAAVVLTKLPLHIEHIEQTVVTPPPVQTPVTLQTGGTVQGRKGFYGISVRENARILFIVDCSGSMGSGSTEIVGKNRLEVVQMELEKVIFNKNRSKYSTGAFAIIKFSDDAQQFPPPKKGLCRYTDQKNLKQSQEFIDLLQPGGSTNMKKAWLTAMEMIKKYRIDTVYFLTDGEPGDGFDTLWLKENMKKNHVKPITVNCITVGGHGKMLMQTIAKEFRGSFIFIP